MLGGRLFKWLAACLARLVEVISGKGGQDGAFMSPAHDVLSFVCIAVLGMIRIAYWHTLLDIEQVPDSFVLEGFRPGLELEAACVDSGYTRQLF